MHGTSSRCSHRRPTARMVEPLSFSIESALPLIDYVRSSGRLSGGARAEPGAVVVAGLRSVDALEGGAVLGDQAGDRVAEGAKCVAHVTNSAFGGSVSLVRQQADAGGG